MESKEIVLFQSKFNSKFLPQKWASLPSRPPQPRPLLTGFIFVNRLCIVCPNEKENGNRNVPNSRKFRHKLLFLAFFKEQTVQLHSKRLSTRLAREGRTVSWSRGRRAARRLLRSHRLTKGLSDHCRQHAKLAFSTVVAFACIAFCVLVALTAVLSLFLGLGILYSNKLTVETVFGTEHTVAAAAAGAGVAAAASVLSVVSSSASSSPSPCSSPSPPSSPSPASSSAAEIQR